MPVEPGLAGSSLGAMASLVASVATGIGSVSGSGNGNATSASASANANNTTGTTPPKATMTATTKAAPARTPAADVAIPALLASGVPMRKVSSKKIKNVIVTLSASTITWPSLKGGKVDIQSIRELRLGQSPTDKYDGARWITIVYVRDKQWKVVHLIAHTDDVYELWVRALRDLVAVASDRVVSGVGAGSAVGAYTAPTHGPAADPDLRFVRQLWPAGVGKVDRATAMSLCAQLGLVVGPRAAAKYEFPLDLAAFRRLIRDIQTRHDLDDLYRSLASANSDGLSREAVFAFLRDIQGETDVSGHSRDVLFDRFADAVTGLWNAESLASFLASPDNLHKVAQDYTRPLYEYFIASSHNTYLVAEQWRGASTVEGYIRVLLAGCRSVEIDVHDGNDGLPVVYHGMTITSSVPIRDVCQAINKYAFVTSPYPVIISLEIRCSVVAQDRLASVLKESFGDRLVTEPLNDIDGTPSPEELKGRILIKTKPHPVPASPTVSISPPAPPGHALVTSSTQDSTDSTTESDSSLVRFARRISLSAGSGNKDAPTPRASPASPSNGHSHRLTELPVYTSAVKYRGFSKLVNYEPHHMFSVSERTANRILREGQEADWIKHNFTHLTRVYPKGVRLTSSNFDPRPYWSAGAQMVAINYQTLDSGSLYNGALFHDGGYVLKPPALRYKSTEASAKYRLRVKIISAQRLPPLADLYVEGTIGETTIKTRPTKAATLGPQWDETMEFDITTKPSLLSLVFLHLELKLPKGVVAQWTRPLPDAGRGYRYLPLDDRDRSRYLFATLFVRIDVLCLTPPPSPPASPRLMMPDLGGELFASDMLMPPAGRSPRRTPSPRLQRRSESQLDEEMGDDE